MSVNCRSVELVVPNSPMYHCLPAAFAALTRCGKRAAELAGQLAGAVEVFAKDTARTQAR